MGFIYKLTYKESRKAYIGQTLRDIEERLKEHQLSSSGCRAISSAIKKHGWENFEKEWYEVPDEDLNFYEEMLVALLGTLAPRGYNLREGGGATGKPSEETKKKMSEAQSGEKAYWYGKEHTEEAKKKMSKARTGENNHMYGKKHTEEAKQKISEANSGKERTEEAKKKMSEVKTGEKHPMYGKEHTEEAKKKMSKVKTGEKHPMYGKEHTEETKKKMSDAKSGEKHRASKRVYQYNLDGTYVHSYGSSGEAARALGKTSGVLIRMCAGGKGKYKTAYGFKWSYTEL
ncbi:GIY-YIG catalytic domain-containing endonuclease [Paramecium bursaria Chlorella virus NW665.2]|nr:GIY-YIG catalytic domain-containing endonuclease [Paramecium bursaria Chlorella virus NW665.2]